MEIKKHLEECNVLRQVAVNAVLTLSSFIKEIVKEMQEKPLKENNNLENEILDNICKEYDEIITAFEDIQNNLGYLAINYKSYIDYLKVIDLLDMIDGVGK